MANMVNFVKDCNQQLEPANGIKSWDIIVRELKVDCLIGIHDFEMVKRQPVSISFRCHVRMPSPVDADKESQYLCYDALIQSIRHLAEENHIHLVETLAEMIANHCLNDERVKTVTVTIEKTAVYGNVGSVGVEISRQRN